MWVVRSLFILLSCSSSETDFADLEVDFFMTKMGGLNKIGVAGHFYVKEKTVGNGSKSRTHWICERKKKRCRGRLVTVNDVVVKLNNKHNHDPIPGRAEALRNYSLLKQMNS